MFCDGFAGSRRALYKIAHSNTFFNKTFVNFLIIVRRFSRFYRNFAISDGFLSSSPFRNRPAVPVPIKPTAGSCCASGFLIFPAASLSNFPGHGIIQTDDSDRRDCNGQGAASDAADPGSGLSGKIRAGCPIEYSERPS